MQEVLDLVRVLGPSGAALTVVLVAVFMVVRVVRARASQRSATNET